MKEAPTIWRLVFLVAAVQVSVAIYARVSSDRSILSDGACLGGIFGTLINMVILALVAAGVLVGAVLSARAGEMRPWMAPLLFLGLSSGLAVLIGSYAGLRCTV